MATTARVDHDAPLFDPELDLADEATGLQMSGEDIVRLAVAAFRASSASGMEARMAAALAAAHPHMNPVTPSGIERGADKLAELRELAREGTDVSVRWASGAVLRAGMRQPC